jgi:hypothetical protein
MATITKDEFERQYAARSGVTVEWLHAHGMHAAQCACDYAGCQGWGMESARIDAAVEILAAVRAVRDAL